jgi:hypothetical protein
MTNRADALRPIQQEFLRAFTGSSRTALAEQAFIAGWLAAQRKAACPLCDAQPGQEHAPPCPRHPSDPMKVRASGVKEVRK